MSASNVQEFAMQWPNIKDGSTHELTYYNEGSTHLWVSGMMDNCLAKVTWDGQATYHPMPDGSQPHGLKYDGKGSPWVSLEYRGTIARLNEDGEIQEEIDVKMDVRGSAPINPHPHGFTFAHDGETIWFTGKKTNTVGKINPDRSVEHFELPTVGAVLIYLSPGPDGNIYGTELVGNNILIVTPKGHITEKEIPTYNSRPIAIVPGPDGKSMWFSQEAGNKVGRLDIETQVITQYSVPMSQKNAILGGMAFDKAGNLWTHSYINQHDKDPAGADYVIKMDKAINNAPAGDLSTVPVTHYEVPSRNTVMHRILQGADGNIWFTELGTDKLGKLTVGGY